jgi:deoxyribodipyrimidine photo-lyase
VAVDPGRICRRNDLPQGPGPVIYWMSREQRLADNWGLLHAQELALAKGAPLGVTFCLAPTFLGATLRQYGFMLRGLAEMEQGLARLGIPFMLLTGEPPLTMASLAAQVGAGAVVTDFDPLQIKQQWQVEAARLLPVSLLEVDGHNIVPCRLVSDHREYGARTLRPKILRLLPRSLTEFPPLVPHPHPWPAPSAPVDWQRLRAGLTVDRSVAETTVTPGSRAGHRSLAAFLGDGLPRFATESNDPTKEAQSGLSPYLHFGQLAPQRVALAVAAGGDDANRSAFLEQLIVRRELADNFCLHTPDYDSVSCFPSWAAATLERHRYDPRPYRYTPEQLETGQSHDRLWNAAQLQMVHAGTMPGYLRMYWAKKILEWSPTVEEALATAIRFNDRYQLDGRDANGYTGIAWSMGGVHDRPWGERPVYGTIRSMTFDGCRRKFDVDAYCRQVQQSIQRG